MGRGIKIGTTVVPALSMSINPQRNTIVEESFGIATQGSVYAGTYGISGSVSAGYRPSTLANIVSFVLGGNESVVAKSIETTGGFSYTTIDVADDYNNISSFASCVVNSMEFTLNTGDFARVTFNFTGIKKKANGTIAAPSYAEKISVFYNAMLTLAAATIKVKSITFRIERPVTPDYIIGSEYAEILNQSGNIAVTGTLGLAANEYSLLLNAMTTGDESVSEPSSDNVNTLGGGELIINLRKPDATAFQTITISQIYVNTGTMSGDGRQVMTKSVDFVAQISSGAENIFFSAVS